MTRRCGGWLCSIPLLFTLLWTQRKLDHNRKSLSTASMFEAAVCWLRNTSAHYGLSSQAARTRSKTQACWITEEIAQTAEVQNTVSCMRTYTGVARNNQSHTNKQTHRSHTHTRTQSFGCVCARVCELIGLCNLYSMRLNTAAWWITA